MKKIIAVAFAAILTSACGQGSYNGDCNNLTDLAVKVSIALDEKARAIAEGHLKLARESKAKNDMPGCEAHMKDARAALEKK